MIKFSEGSFSNVVNISSFVGDPLRELFLELPDEEESLGTEFKDSMKCCEDGLYNFLELKLERLYL